MAKFRQSKASSEVLDSGGPSSTRVCPQKAPGGHGYDESVFHISFLSPFPAECRDTTRYCEKVKQLKLCQLNQFQSRCCGTYAKA